MGCWLGMWEKVRTFQFLTMINCLLVGQEAFEQRMQEEGLKLVLEESESEEETEGNNSQVSV